MTASPPVLSTTADRQPGAERTRSRSSGWDVGWLTFLLVSLYSAALYAAAIPFEFRRLQRICTGVGCDLPDLTPAMVHSLHTLGLSTSAYALFFAGVYLLAGAICLILGGLIAWHRSAEPMAFLAALFLVTFGTSISGIVDRLSSESAALGLPVACLKFAGLASLVPFFLLFPDGRFVPRWTGMLGGVWVLTQVPSVFFPSSPASLYASPVGQLIWFALLFSVVPVQFYRYRRVSGPLQRQQTKCVVAGLAIGLLSFLALALLYNLLPATMARGVVGTILFEFGLFCSILLIPTSIGMAILRYHLWDIDVIINRALVYGALTAGIVGLYILLVGGLGGLLQARGNLLLSLVATGVVAVLFQPARERLQRGVNRLMYGQRDEPYTVLSRLGQQLEQTLASDAILPSVVQTVAGALKLPYAAILLSQGDERYDVVAVVGAPTDDSVALPLLYQGEMVGQLVLGTRSGEAVFSPADRHLLDDLARQAGVAAYAVRLTADLQRSRERLVAAREEERRRLRRDLHDGLGPSLATMAMQSEAARDLMASDPGQSDALLSDLTNQLQAATADIRRLVHELRPPALDDLGLVGALRNQIGRFDRGPLRITLDVPDSLPALPAAVEVAAYRIVLEALNNVVRHAGAERCYVRFCLDSTAGLLSFEIRDDGGGVPSVRRAGVGLTSMQERAAELGGICVIEAGDTGGTLVHATVPLTLDGYQPPGVDATVC